MDTGPRVHVIAIGAIHGTDINHTHAGWMNLENGRGLQVILNSAYSAEVANNGSFT